MVNVCRRVFSRCVGVALDGLQGNCFPLLEADCAGYFYSARHLSQKVLNESEKGLPRASQSNQSQTRTALLSC